MIDPLQATHCIEIARPIENCYNLIYLSHAYRWNRLQRSKLNNKAFLLIWLKKYLNPHQNSCSKLISILTTGNILHESSSAPRQYKSVQLNGLLCTYTEMFRIQTCCNHILSAAEGFRGQEATCANPGIFVSFIKSSAYFTVYRGGPMVLLLSKLYLPRIQRGSIIFQGVSNFFQGVPNANFFRNPYTYLLFSRGVSGPLSPSGSAHGQCHHDGTIFIKIPLLTK